ncbi:MAG: PP2C family protein-serine/threonine phosphatase [Actinomycetota bacterium]
MIDEESGMASILRLLEDLNGASPARLMPVLLERLRSEVGAVGLRLLVVDLDESRLEDRRVLGAGVGLAEGAVPLAGSPQGEAYRSGVTQVVGDESKTTIMAPVTARQVREGVLEVVVDRTGVTDRDVDAVRSASLLLGYAINAADRWTDEFHVTRRRKEMSLPAEMQWSQLPLTAFATEDVSLAGALEPAYEVGGDSFDYACDADRLSAGVFDAMGHGLTAARLSAFGIATYRNARRRGDDITAQAATMHDALRSVFEREGYMTAVMVQIDLMDPRRSSILRAGHHAPILQRAGRPPTVLDVEGGLPFGMPFDETVPVGPLALQTGDRLVLFSDGVVEARPDDGEAYGLESLIRELEALQDLSPREATRRVTRAVREHRSADLADDATILMIDILPRG